MEVILKQDVTGLGYKNDTVKVKPGYGNNYLIPNGFALIANDSNKRLINENVRQAAHKAAKIKQDAEALAAKVGDLTIEVGTVTALQIADVLKAKGFDIDRKKVHLKEIPKQLGTYTATLDLHKEVKHDIQVKVVAE